ncbi:RNA polymerase sigma factor [Opitutus terrae]|uniref:RNA polymerase, sigma-24 subunit, ECF subfamily n=1 Tax=Opitutus terrae (strain DSM 11246 / JCM 15787 / PB90-1) TaxID=452637 RepID=B1ZPS4_OPITP|nr:sigma-70 family RNA polymerase sigma factor [Opitutus terrae]ACB75527.1 RNA polymerase, sigma-24 subunit, ECF subfamily [Opitutus terrae PB90-1]
MNDDASLLHAFATKRDEAAFRQLVGQRIGFVYAVALRRLNDPHLAQEATQSVFIALARKAARVAQNPSVMGWLHRCCCYETHNLMRAQINRAAREQEAHQRGTTTAPSPSGHRWEEIETVLDDALSELAEPDRSAILARYFSNQSFAEIGTASGRTENAARMRVERALSKLREQLQRRGFDSTAAVLAGLLPSSASALVPSGLSTTIADAALSTVGTTSLLAVFVATMSTTKITATLAAVAGLGIIGYQIHQTNVLAGELGSLRAEHARATETVRALENQIRELKTAPASTTAVGTATAATATTAVAAKAEPVEVPGITRQAPPGWFKNGNNTKGYDVGVDQTQPWGGMPSAYVKSNDLSTAEGFGGMMQVTAADVYRGQRVRLSGWMKTQDVQDEGAHLWLRVDGKGRGNILAFDNMRNRAPKGTTDWQEYSIVLDVPRDAEAINYGMFLAGRGQIWVNALTVTAVGAETPITNPQSLPKPPNAPVNLGFNPDSTPKT